MLRPLQRIVLLFLLVQAWTGTSAQDPPFPKMSDIFDEFYQAEVQLSDQNQDGTSLATEYYDSSQDRGRLDVLVYGNRLSIYYYGQVSQILEVNSTSCIVSDAEISDYFYAEIFFGWLSKDPLVIGPSALLWFAQKQKPVYVDTVEVRGIKCDYYQLKVDKPNEKIDYGFYFAVKEWSTPYQLKGKRVPIKITVNGESSRESEKKSQVAPINQVVEYSYFKTTIDDTKLQPDIGLGCYERESEFEMPKIPREFRYATEVYNLLKAEKQEDTDATFLRVWFSTYMQLARLDIYKRDTMSSNIYDFKNGVTYSIKNTQTCTISPLRNSMFVDDSDLSGYIKTPEQVMGLTGDFYYMGYRPLRGMYCRVFESAVRRAIYNNQEFYLLVTTVYFTEPFTKVVVRGEDEVNVPVFIQVTGYDKPNNVAVKMQYNIFAFDDVIGPTMLADFPLDDCFPLSNQKAYFIVNFIEKVDIVRKFEGNDFLFLDSLKYAIMSATNVSDIRIPYLKADYTNDGAFVTGLMLDRPPLLSQFWKFFYGPSKSFDVKKIDNAKTQELCAFSCVDEREFLCKGFHFCGGSCYINERYIHEERINAATVDLGVCEVYIRTDLNSTTRDPYLPKALELLKNAKIKVKIVMVNGSLEVPVDEIIVGEGPYRKNVTDKSYNVAYYGYQLPAAADITTAVEKPDVSSETECYKTCKTDPGIACQSFSYCPDATAGQCRISSLFLESDENFSLLENNKLCNVYTLLSLDYFDPYPGKVLKVKGEDTFNNVSAEQCAVKCKTEKSFTCRGFEYCSTSKSCLLHSKHVVDVKDGDIIDTDAKCTHYAAKFSADYLDFGLLLIDDFTDERTDLSLEQCARVCSEEVETCKSFNYCPPDEYGNGGACSLTSKTLYTRGVKTITKKDCHLYSKRDHVEGYGTRRRRRPSGGVTKSGLTGLVIGMLLFGLFVGIASFVGFSYYRSRRYNDGMSVKFVNQPSS